MAKKRAIDEVRTYSASVWELSVQENIWHANINKVESLRF